jgi:hypothetical protein
MQKSTHNYSSALIMNSVLHLIFFGARWQTPIFESLCLCPNLSWANTNFWQGGKWKNHYQVPLLDWVTVFFGWVLSK